MGSLIRFRARKDDGTLELTIGFSKRLLAGLAVLALAVVSFGYAVMPAQSDQSMSRAKKAINPNRFYSEAVEAGDFVFLSGKIATSRGQVIEGGIKAETKQVMDNLAQALEKSGLGMADVVRTTVYLKSLDDYAGMNEVYETYFEKDPPARSTVQTGVVLGASVEIDMIAYRGGK